MAQIVFILGGVRSGKSRFAQDLARQISENDVLFVATAEAGDAEMLRRIEHHRMSRPAGWSTVEVAQNVGVALDQLQQRGSKYRTVLIDCLTLLISNVLLSCD